MLAPWTTWWQNDLPCQFSRERTQENCAYLVSTLGKSWVEKGVAKAGRGNHPLRRRWSNNGANSYLELNGLAEDLRVVDSAPGIDAVVKDLKHSEKSEPARHVIRFAALFARDKSTRIVEFVVQKSSEVPDFMMDINGSNLAVEAKLMSKSDDEEIFEQYANLLTRQIFMLILNKTSINPHIQVIIKTDNELPKMHDVITTISQRMNEFHESPLWSRSETFNIMITRPPLNDAMEFYRFCMILCPRSAKENIRVQKRAQKASSQLLADSENDRTGLFCLELREYQNPHVIRDLLVRRFSQSQYRGISGVLLSRSGTHLGPPQRSTVQFMGTVNNPSSCSPVPAGMQIAPLGPTFNLFEVFPQSEEVPAYRFSELEAKGTSNAKFYLPKIATLTRKMLD